MENHPLLIIDLQNDFLSKVSENYIEKTMAFLEQWSPDNVYWLRYLNHPDSLYDQHIDYRECMTSPGKDLIPPPVSHNGQQRIVDHFGYSPPPELIAEIKENGHKAVGICGVDTDACVMASCFALWDNGLQPLIYQDYCASSGGENMHTAALSMMYRQFGVKSVR